MTFSSTLLFALTFFLANPIWADADASKRIQALSQKIDQSPDDQALLLQRAWLYVELNQSDLAIVDVQLAESLGDPTEAAFTHGVLLYRQGDFDAALPYFDRYLKAYPEHWSGLGYRARILRKLGDNRGALADYEALIRLNDALNPGDYIAAARLMANLPGRGVDAALVLLDERVAKRGPVISLQRYAIELETGRGNYAAAIERMALLDQKLRATPQWQVDVAELMLLDGRGEEALSYLAVAQEQLAAGRKTAIHQQLIETARHLQERVMNSMQRADDGLEAQPPQS